MPSGEVLDATRILWGRVDLNMDAAATVGFGYTAGPRFCFVRAMVREAYGEIVSREFPLVQS